MTMNTPLGLTSLHMAINHPVLACVVLGGIACGSLIGLAPEKNQKYVAITFDDGYSSDIKIAKPILEKYGFVATSYVNTASIGNENRLSWKNVKALDSAGWEIGSHGRHHIDMKTMTDKKLKENIVDALYDFSVSNVTVPTSFSTPYGSFDDRVRAIFEPTYLTHVNAWSDKNGITKAEWLDRYNIHRLDSQNSSIAELCEKVKNLETNTLFTVIFHEVTAGETTKPYKVSAAQLEDFAKCLKAADVSVVTLTDGVARING